MFSLAHMREDIAEVVETIAEREFAGRNRVDPNRKDFETPFQVRVLADGEERLFKNVATYVVGRPHNQVIVHNFRIGPKVKIAAPAEVATQIGHSLKLPFELTRVNTPGPATISANRLPTGVKADPVVGPSLCRCSQSG